jgi:DNA-binding transcriptional ArsR family regulator
MTSTVVIESPFRLPAEPSEPELVAKYLRVLSDPIRLRIVELIADGERSVGALVDELGVAQPKVSNHLACLRWCGFVETRREHRTVYYRLADSRVREIVELARGLLAENAEHVAACRRVDGSC